MFKLPPDWLQGQKGQLDSTNRFRTDSNGGYPHSPGDSSLACGLVVAPLISSIFVGWAWFGVAGLFITFFFVGLPLAVITTVRFSNQVMAGELEEDPDRVTRARRVAGLWIAGAGVALALAVT